MEPEQLFKKYDKDRDGFISKKEFEGICEGLMLDTSHIDEVFSELEKSANGLVSYFIALSLS